MDHDKGQALRGSIQFEVDDPRHGGLNDLKWPTLDGEKEGRHGGRRIKRRLGTRGWLLKPIKLFPRDRTVGESPGTQEHETRDCQDFISTPEVSLSCIWVLIYLSANHFFYFITIINEWIDIFSKLLDC